MEEERVKIHCPSQREFGAFGVFARLATEAELLDQANS